MRTRIHRAEYESAASLHAKVNTPRLGPSQSVLDTIGRTPAGKMDYARHRSEMAAWLAANA